MEESVLFPSPNWFQASGLSVSSDGWMVYGGPSKSLCVLEPLPLKSTGVIHGDHYRAHVLHRAHAEKIVSVDINPEWPKKKVVLTGSADGSVKQWGLELINNKYKFKSTHSHDVHHNEKEEVAGLGYSSDIFAVTVGCFGNIVKWDLNSNVVKSYNQFLKNFKPTCVSCSQHMLLTLAVGTKQGVIFVLDLNGPGKPLYKVRGQDDEIVNVSWCPQYEVVIKKYLKDSDKRVSANERLAKIRQEAGDPAQNLNQSAVTKDLPEDSFDESTVVEDDMFDIYKDHEMDAFGPKKYQPEEILVKVKEEVKPEDNYLAECMKLKEAIIKKKNEPEPSMASLVEALEKTHVENEYKHADDHSQGSTEGKDSIEEECSSVNGKKGEASIHMHKHLLATIGKQGGVRIWSKSGKLVGSCAVTSSSNKNQWTKQPTCTTLLWYKSDTLLIADGKSQLLRCNPLKVDCKNKLEFQVVHSIHKRGLYSIVSDAPRVQTPENATKEMASQWSVWTAAQDRNLVRYSLESKKTSIHTTCGGFLYMIQSCPYDANKVAISVGDGAVRVWEADTTAEDDTRLCPGSVTTYWQNVQGKVLTVAWHPTKENLLAFGTAESRVGLIDTSGRVERPAKTLVPALNGGVYSLCWGDGGRLYASAGDQLALYHTARPDQQPETIRVSVEGQQWGVSCVYKMANTLAVGSTNGAVAILDEQRPDNVLAAHYCYTKMIYNVECHPQETSESNDESAYKNLIAVTALDKQNTITILEYGDKEDGTKQLQTWKVLSGHKGTVLQVAWNPHREEFLLSTSQDSTVRIWDIVQGACVSIFDGHVQCALSAAWCSRPQLHDHVLSGGSDCTLRLWRAGDFPSNAYSEIEHSSAYKKDKKKMVKEKKEGKKAEEVKIESAGQARMALLEKVKISKKYLLPIISRQIVNCQLQGARKMLQNYIHNKCQSINDKVEINTDNSKDKSLKTESDFVMEHKNCSTDINDHTSSKDNNSCTGVTRVNGKDTSAEENAEPKSAEDENISTESKDTSTDSKDTSAEVKGTSPDAKDAFFEEKEYGTDFIKMFGSTNEVNEVLDMEMEYHLLASNLEAYIMLSIFRGHIDAMIKFASSRDLLCPYLISISPCVSFKYWKDATQLYLAQIDRLVAKGEEEKLYYFKCYGGTVYRKVGSLLSVHDVKGAVNALVESRLYKEAYILCRTRHMDSIAQETLNKWAKNCYNTGNCAMAAVCYLALGDLSEAATILGKSNKPDCLCVAAEIAKVAGHNIFAEHIEERKSNIKPKEPITETEDLLEDLPTRMELLLKNTENVEESSLLAGDVKTEE